MSFYYWVAGVLYILYIIGWKYLLPVCGFVCGFPLHYLNGVLCVYVEGTYIYITSNLPFKIFLSVSLVVSSTVTLLCNHCHHPSPELLHLLQLKLHPLNSNCPYSSLSQRHLFDKTKFFVLMKNNLPFKIFLFSVHVLFKKTSLI